MTKKEKERSMKLARYITCALLLGNGLLFAPMAEAADDIHDVDSGVTTSGVPQGGQDYSGLNLRHYQQESGTSESRYGIRFNSTNTEWNNCGVAAISGSAKSLYQYGVVKYTQESGHDKTKGYTITF